jgi:N-acetyl-anhydromuramyl-L-alanine amidase AmpD
MSFVEFLQDDPLLTREQVMRTLIEVADELDMPEKRSAVVIAGMVVSQEAGVVDNDPPHERRFWCPANHADPESFDYEHDSVSDDGRSVGYFQQQRGPDGAEWWGPVSEEMDLHAAATKFMTRLKDVGYDGATAQTANDAAQSVQQSGVPDAYAQHFDDINRLYDKVQGAGPAPGEDGDSPSKGRPDFNEYAIWSPNRQNRNGTPVDLFFIHTEQGESNADQLARTTLKRESESSYHYTVSQDPNDDGVTVVDCVDTDLAAWSVGDANNRSINLCFAGSYAEWSRDEWMAQSKAIDVAAFLAVQDCQKYNIPVRVLAPPDYQDPPGISDHNYVTEYLGWGNHWDVGEGFPWDYFEERVNRWAGLDTEDDTDFVDENTPVDDFKREVAAQVRGRWAMLGWQTVVETLAELRDEITGSSDAGKSGFSW